VKDWANLPKPWSREDCRDRYVIGDKIGLRKLAEISGVQISSIFAWSSADDWPSDRKQFQSETVAKTRESVSDAIAEKSAAIIERHLEGFKDFATLGISLGALAQQCSDQMAEQAPIDPYRLQALTGASTNAANVFKTAVEGQRQALWLDAENINVAIGIVEKHGYRVSEADAEDTASDQKIPDQNFIEVAPDDVPPTP
jgi:hypothetical protein